MKFLLAALGLALVRAQSSIETFNAVANSYVVSEGDVHVLIDVGEFEAGTPPPMLETLLAKSKPLSHMFLTHAHNDHIGNVPMIKEAFPNAQVWVATQKIKDAVVKQALAELDASFDWAKEVQVLPSDVLDVWPTVRLNVEAGLAHGESPAASYLHGKVAGSNAFFSGDLLYGNWFPWLGGGVGPENVANWVGDLRAVQTAFAGQDYTLYPGHGTFGEIALNDAVTDNLSYLSWVLKAVCEEGVEWSAGGMKAQAMEKYPNFAGDFLWDCCFLDNPDFLAATPGSCDATVCVDSSGQRCDPAARKLLFGASKCMC